MTSGQVNQDSSMGLAAGSVVLSLGMEIKVLAMQLSWRLDSGIRHGLKATSSNLQKPSREQAEVEQRN